jgi:hypothetical protein
VVYNTSASGGKLFPEINEPANGPEQFGASPKIIPGEVRAGPYIDGNALIRAKSRSRAKFEALVAHYRKRGASDHDLVKAMVESPALIDGLGKKVRR